MWKKHFLKVEPYSVAQAGFKLGILLPQPPKNWITNLNHHVQLKNPFGSERWLIG